MCEIECRIIVRGCVQCNDIEGCFPYLLYSRFATHNHLLNSRIWIGSQNESFVLTFSAFQDDLFLFREIAYRRTNNIVFSRIHRQYIMSVFSDVCIIFSSGDVYTRPGKRLTFPILYIAYDFCRLMPLREPWQGEHEA